MNEDDLKQSEPAVTIDNSTIVEILNDYKIFLRKNLENKLNKAKLFNFYEFLEKNIKIEKYYTLLDLVKEFESLENQFFELNKLSKEDLKFLYELLLDRINERAKILNNNNQESKKLLNYLYTSILIKLFNLEHDLESDLIINVDLYLNILKQNMKELKDLKIKNIRKEIIVNHKNKYQHSIQLKIEKSRDIIDKNVLTKLDITKNEMNHKIDNLIKEVITIVKKAEEDNDNLRKTKDELKNQMILKSALGVVKSVGIFTSMILILKFNKINCHN